MTGAMYAAVSGLKTHMSALNVIGNNVSNVNTYGYKATRYTFDEALYTTVRNGSNGGNGNVGSGGRNPAQVGYGCSVGTIDLDMSTKNYTPTGYGLDCMINGDGFFVVGKKDSVINSKETLNGATLSRLGNLEFHDGYLVDGNGSVVMGYACLRANEGDDAATNPYIFNTASMTALRYPNINAATGEVLPRAVDENGNVNYGEGVLPVLDSISIDEKTGLVSGIYNDTSVVIGYIAIAKVDNPNGVTHVDGRYYQALAGAGDVHATSLNGVVLAPAPADNAPGIEIKNSGDVSLITGGLESSGTDLATEISNMIVIQRGYQANTRIVTVTDSMLEELVNMKR